MSKLEQKGKAVSASAAMSKGSDPPFTTFNYTQIRPKPYHDHEHKRMMDNLFFIHEGEVVKYSVEFTDERTTLSSGPSSVFLHFNVTCINSKGEVIPLLDKAPPEVKVPTNFEYVSMEERAIRLILDIFKDAAAGGVSKAVMEQILTSLGFNVGIIKGKTIDLRSYY